MEEEESKESLIISLWRYNGLVLFVNARAIAVPIMVVAEAPILPEYSQYMDSGLTTMMELGHPVALNLVLIQKRYQH